MCAYVITHNTIVGVNNTPRQILEEEYGSHPDFSLRSTLTWISLAWRIMYDDLERFNCSFFSMQRVYYNITFEKI